jgi:hypothetical protein
METPPNNQNNNPEDKPSIDIDSILLPKSNTPPPSTQRVEAGAILADQRDAIAAREAPVEKPPMPPAAKINEDTVKPLQTYQADIEQAVGTQQVSVVSIAAAEAERRSRTANEPQEATAGVIAKNLGFIVGGVALLVVAIGAVSYALLRPTSTTLTQQTIAAPFITVDETQPVPLVDTTYPGSIMQQLTSAKLSTKLSLGLVERLLPVMASTSGQSVAVSSQIFLPLLASNIPDSLVRTMQPDFLLGVHSFAGNQPFLIVKVDSYQQAFSGMLGWEATMPQDLLPLFAYTPAAHENTTTTTTTNTPASSTQATTLPIASPFVDKVVENHDARVLYNNTGDIVLLWTFVDQHTLAITTNPATLREIISRLSVAPIQPAF